MKLITILLASAAASLPLVAIDAGTAAIGAEHPHTFAPPPEPLVLSRTVIRELSDGKQVLARRRYSVRFLPDAAGFRLEGKLLDVAVEAPPFLARLAEIERSRPESGLFPMRLDARGMISAASGIDHADQAIRRRVGQQASQLIDVFPGSGAAKSEANGVLGQVLASDQPMVWPADLFVAHPGERHARKAIPLPDGSQGEIDVLVRVEAFLACGLPRRVERVVTTTTGGTRRIAREVWALECPGA